MTRPSRRSSGSSGSASVVATTTPASDLQPSCTPFAPDWFSALLLLTLIILAYQPAWNAGFIWDDDAYVTRNRLLTDPDGLRRIWFSTDSPSQYFPLVYTTFRLERSLWGLNPAGYHWVSILFHAANALLLWRLLRRLAIPGAWFAAALFALHPVQVESVAWITERKNVLSLFFILLSLHAWVRFISSPPGKAWKIYGLAIFCYALALFSKTTACTLPAVLLLILWLKQYPITRARLLQVGPFVALGLAMGLLSNWWERFHIRTQGAEFAIAFPDRLLIASRAVFFYLGKLIWPINLTFSYPRWEISATTLVCWIWPVLALLACGAIFFARRFFGRGPEVAATFFVATLFPTLGFIMLYTFRYTFVADHYQYVAAIGPLTLAATAFTVGLSRWDNRLPLLKPICAGIVLLTLGVLTIRQAGIYKNLETLWSDTLNKNPQSWMARDGFGSQLLAQGLASDAAAQFQKAIELNPNEARSYDNLGIAFEKMGRVDDSITQFQKALTINPFAAKTHNNLGLALMSRGRFDEAAKELQAAVQLDAHESEARNNLAMALARLGQLDEAIVQLHQAIRLNPNNPQAHNNLGLALSRKKDYPEAVAEFETSLRLNPNSPETHTTLGALLAQLGRRDEASTHFMKALQIRPDFAEAARQLKALQSSP
jgi:Flp pilus assembly protein TadD